MDHRQQRSRRVVAVLAAGAALATATAAGGVHPPAADAATRCPASGAKVYKKVGSRIVFTRKIAKEGTVYYACSTTYRKTVRLDADASELVDVIFSVKKASFYGNTLTFRSCEESDVDTTCQTVKADLKTGKKTVTSTKDSDGSDAD